MPHITRLVTLAAVAVCAAACSSSSPTNSDVNKELADLRAATAQFQSFDAAVAAGYNAKLTDCMVNPPVGGMGFHYAKPSLIDGHVSVASPQVLLYEPAADGTMQLLAVEYIVPYTILPRSSTPPVLFGQQFKQNDSFMLWGLHAWIYRNNPSGTFANWNPDVTCSHASSASHMSHD
jgi:hypothetical protein